MSDDGCTSCTVDDDYTCSGISPDVCTHKCGNGIVDPAGSYTEGCDDGNLIAGDGCSIGCLVEDDFTCSGNSPSVCTHKCGDGVRNPLNAYTEDCDDGNLLNGDGCSTSCTVEDAFTCTGSIGSIDVCTSRCGNGAMDPIGVYTEECDDSNTVAEDGCSNCIIEEFYPCSRSSNAANTPDVCVTSCGNGIEDNGE